MRMRLGLVIGFGAGYYLGAKAGTERYEELNRMIEKVRRSDAYENAAEKAKAAVDLGVERARDLASDHADVPPVDNGWAPTEGAGSTPSSYGG